MDPGNSETVGEGGGGGGIAIEARAQPCSIAATAVI